MKKLIIVADAGKLRAFRLIPGDMSGSRDRIEEVQTQLQLPYPPPTDASDDDGNFPSGFPGSGAPMKHGESHGREQEEERRAIKAVVNAITALVDDEGFEVWNLAAPARVCKRLLDQIPLALKERLTRVEEHDYTGLPVKEIEKVFI